LVNGRSFVTESEICHKSRSDKSPNRARHTDPPGPASPWVRWISFGVLKGRDINAATAKRQHKGMRVFNTKFRRLAEHRLWTVVYPRFFVDKKMGCGLVPTTHSWWLSWLFYLSDRDNSVCFSFFVFRLQNGRNLFGRSGFKATDQHSKFFRGIATR